MTKAQAAKVLAYSQMGYRLIAGPSTMIKVARTIKRKDLIQVINQDGVTIQTTSRYISEVSK